jgi:hypothetical protein
MCQYCILKVSFIKMTRTHPLGAPNMEVFHSTKIKMAHFTCFFEPIFQEPEHMHVDHFKYVKLLVYMSVPKLE